MFVNWELISHIGLIRLIGLIGLIKNLMTENKKGKPIKIDFPFYIEVAS